ncbi:acetate--CoA ligase family protein [Falsiroseomonas ponticola]|uniref:acetate--CoA ligase family protein n=1 Tax=Falsiroseomonas ponticola TaxID=2786951 RepID=UPI001931FE49|nr:acetate--CoA ligase family protein [Roseomonas ponticola]
MTSSPLQRLFQPRHVALLGVSRNRAKAGYRYLRYILDGGFQGTVSLLGTEEGEIDGCRLYADAADLPQDIDLAFSMLGPAATMQTLPRVAERRLAFAIVFTAGFAEMGAEGAAAQAELVRRCNAHGTRIIGPNCMGMFNLPHGLNISRAKVARGRVGMISQSGNVGLTLWDQSPLLDAGFSTFISFGNQADIRVHEYIAHLGDDPETGVIAAYIEGLQPGSGQAFLETCARVSRRKPIVVLKGGRAQAGRRAAMSHTASLSSSERIFDALLREAGVIEVKHLEHLLPVAQALLLCPPLHGDNIAIVGSGGGHSIMFTDEIEAAGLQVPPFSPALQDALRQRLPAYAPVGNPLDMTGGFDADPSLFTTLTEQVMAQDPGFDGVVNYGLYGNWPLLPGAPHDYVTAAPLAGAMQARLGKPVIYYTPFAIRPGPSFTALRESGVPCFDDMALAAAAMAALRRRGAFLDRAPDSPPPLAAVPGAIPQRDALATESGAYAFLAAHGIRVPRTLTARTAEEAAAAAAELGFPVVIKAILPGVAHKSDLGGVRTGIGDAGSAAAAAAAIAASVGAALGAGALAGFLVTPDLGRQREFFFGVRRDPTLGAVGLLGLGGVLVEALDDVAACLLPATPEAVSRAIARLGGRDYFGAVRGQPAVPPAAVADLLNGLHAALISVSGIDSVECNPTMWTAEGLVPVDAVIAWSDAAASPGAG